MKKINTIHDETLIVHEDKAKSLPSPIPLSKRCLAWCIVVSPSHSLWGPQNLTRNNLLPYGEVFFPHQDFPFHYHTLTPLTQDTASRSLVQVCWSIQPKSSAARMGRSHGDFGHRIEGTNCLRESHITRVLPGTLDLPGSPT
jgi:hypothetical protein